MLPPRQCASKTPHLPHVWEMKSSSDVDVFYKYICDGLKEE